MVEEIEDIRVERGGEIENFVIPWACETCGKIWAPQNEKCDCFIIDGLLVTVLEDHKGNDNKSPDMKDFFAKLFNNSKE